MWFVLFVLDEIVSSKRNDGTSTLHTADADIQFPKNTEDNSSLPWSTRPSMVRYPIMWETEFWVFLPLYDGRVDWRPLLGKQDGTGEEPLCVMCSSERNEVKVSRFQCRIILHGCVIHKDGLQYDIKSLWWGMTHARSHENHFVPVMFTGVLLDVVSNRSIYVDSHSSLSLDVCQQWVLSVLGLLGVLSAIMFNINHTYLSLESCEAQPILISASLNMICGRGWDYAKHSWNVFIRLTSSCTEIGWFLQ